MSDVERCGFARIEYVRAAPKGERQGASLNIPARLYAELGRPRVFMLYVDRWG